MKSFGVITILLLFGLVSNLFAVDGFPGSTLDFDGNEYVEVPYSANLNPNEFTISFWAKVDGGEGTSRSVITSRSTTTGFMLYASNNDHWEFWIRDGGTISDKIEGPTVVLDEWTHITATYDGFKMSLYVNGRFAGSKSDVSIAINIENPLRIGAGKTEDIADYFFIGKIDELSFYNSSRNIEEIRENIHSTLLGSELNLISYWQFNEGTGTVLSDAVGTNNGNLLNLEVEDWVNSTIPLGTNFKDTHIVSSIGNIVFTDTDFELDFTEKTGTDSFTVNKINLSPNILPNGTDEILDSQYWVINKYGDGTYTGNMSFVTSENFSQDYEANPSYVKLYKRASNSDGDWSFVVEATSADSSNNSLIFSDISDTDNQYIVCLDDIISVNTDIDLSNDLTIYADSRTGSNGNYTFSGNVNINDILYFDGAVDVTIHPDQNSRISTDYKFYVKTQTGSKYLKNYNGEKKFIIEGEKLTVDGYKFTLKDEIGGFSVLVPEIRIDVSSDYIDVGYIPNFPKPVSTILAYSLGNAGAIGTIDMGIQYHKNGDEDISCFIEDLAYINMAMRVTGFNITYNPAEERFGGGFRLAIPGVPSKKSENGEEEILIEGNENDILSNLESLPLNVKTEFGNIVESTTLGEFLEDRGGDKKAAWLGGMGVQVGFVSGAIDEFMLSLETTIPVGTTGLFITRLEGGVKGLYNNRIKLHATINLGTALDPLITLEDLGVRIGPGYISGGGKIKVFKQTISSGSIWYSKKKKALKIKGRINLAGILKGKLYTSMRKDRFRGKSSMSLNTPDIDKWALRFISDERIGYVKAYVKNSNRFRAKAKFKYSRWCDPLKFAIQLKFDSSYSFPYFRFYAGRNFNHLRRYAKGIESGKQVIEFEVKENSSQLMVVAGDDNTLFDFTVMDPDGVVYDSTNTSYFQSETTKQTVMTIKDPTPGDWDFHTAFVDSINFEAMELDQEPTVLLNYPFNKATRSKQISLDFTDYADTLNVGIFYDTDNKDFDGVEFKSVELENNATIDFNWDTSEINNGDYYIYVMIDDGGNAPVCQYSPGSIRVETWVVNPPQNLTAVQYGDSILVKWDQNNDPNVTYKTVHIQNISDNLMDEFTVFDEDSLEIKELEAGREYKIWATYSNEDDNSSFESNSVNVIFSSSSKDNNVPYFTMKPDSIFTFVVGEFKEYEFSAFDLDGDALTYDIIDKPAEMSIIGDKFNWSPLEDDMGVYNLKFTVTDGIAIDSIYKELIVYNETQTEIELLFSSRNLYKDDILFVKVSNLLDTASTAVASYINPFTNEAIQVALRRADEFNYIGRVNLPDFPTNSPIPPYDPINYEDYPIVLSYTYEGVTYTTSAFFNPNPQGVDTTPPADITDLVATKLPDNKVLLKWTAQGDDGSFGEALYYGLKYNYTGILNESDYSNATTIGQINYPSVAGSTDSTIIDLTQLLNSSGNDEIFFSIKSVDEMQNWSGISNTVAYSYMIAANNVLAESDIYYTSKLSWEGPEAKSKSKSKSISKLTNSKSKAESDFLNYRILRKLDENVYELLTESITSTVYFDSLKNEIDGDYRYAIQTVYSTGISDTIFSNILTLDRFENVSFVCRFEEGDDHSGIDMEITGLDSIYSQAFNEVTDISGFVGLSSLFKTDYEIELTKTDYITILDTVTVTSDSTEFNWVMYHSSSNIDDDLLPAVTKLYQNYPNPFNPVTSIKYDLAMDSRVKLVVYNSKGELVKILVNNEMKSAGRYKFDFIANSLPSGVYYYELKAGNGYSKIFKAMLIK